VRVEVVVASVFVHTVVVESTRRLRDVAGSWPEELVIERGVDLERRGRMFAQRVSPCREVLEPPGPRRS
jgi:hypothetical protein